jgi:hypothetical protein
MEKTKTSLSNLNNMHKKILTSLLIILSLCTYSGFAIAELFKLKAYAAIKENICTKYCEVDSLDGFVKRPDKGFIFSQGALSAQYPRRHFVMDFDNSLLTEVVLQYDYKTEKSSLVKKETTKLSILCVNQLIETANKIWALKAWLEVNMIMDVGWNLDLLDAETVRKEGGPGTPSGLAVTLSNQLKCR